MAGSRSTRARGKATLCLTFASVNDMVAFVNERWDVTDLGLFRAEDATDGELRGERYVLRDLPALRIGPDILRLDGAE